MSPGAPDYVKTESTGAPTFASKRTIVLFVTQSNEITSEAISEA